jgi:hypothetical protein
MTKLQPPTAREILALIRTLPPEEQEVIRKSLNAPPAPAPFTNSVMETLSEAARFRCKSTSQISRDCARGKLVTNGKQGRELRVCLWSVLIASVREIPKRLSRHWRLEKTPVGEALGVADDLLRELLAECPGGWDRFVYLEDLLLEKLDGSADYCRKRYAMSLGHPPSEGDPREIYMAIFLLEGVSLGMESFPLHNK